MSFKIDDIQRCPHCNIADPNLGNPENFSTQGRRTSQRFWAKLLCNSCGGVILIEYKNQGNPEILEMWPEEELIDETIPDRPADLLEQALKSFESNPVGSIVTTSAAIDAMLNDRGYTEETARTRLKGTKKKSDLFNRIQLMAEDHLITPDMADWAHVVRKWANIQRHQNDKTPLPTQEEAEEVYYFAEIFSEYLYVLPQRVQDSKI